MIKHVWTVLCKKSLIDKDSNNITLIEILEKINIRAKLPIVIPMSFECVTLWARESHDEALKTQSKLELISPAGADVHEIAVTEIDLTKHYRVRSRVRVPSMPVSEHGTYYFSVSLKEPDGEKWKEQARIPLEVEEIS